MTVAGGVEDADEDGDAAKRERECSREVGREEMGGFGLRNRSEERSHQA